MFLATDPALPFPHARALFFIGFARWIALLAIRLMSKKASG
jgi:hypothetical protein